MKDGDVLLLENTRFHDGEEKNDESFVSGLAALGDVYVNDAFSAAHRAHASTEGLAHHLPSYAGRTMQAELEALEKGLGQPEKPVIAIVGGAKVSTKIDLLQNLVTKVDCLVIGGGMANTFLAAQGKDVGKSLCEHDLADTAKAILAAAETSGCTILLPVDAVVAREFKANAENETVPVDRVPSRRHDPRRRPASVGAITEWIDKSKTLVWNGPLGAFELEPFDKATMAAARHAASRTEAGQLVSVAGGGDTVAALNRPGVGALLLRVDGGRRLPRMDGRQAAAGRRRTEGLTRPRIGSMRPALLSWLMFPVYIWQGIGIRRSIERMLPPAGPFHGWPEGRVTRRRSAFWCSATRRPPVSASTGRRTGWPPASPNDCMR